MYSFGLNFQDRALPFIEEHPRREACVRWHKRPKVIACSKRVRPWESYF